MSGAPEPTHDQKADPQHGEPREILVKHPAPWKRSVEWGARIPVLFWNVEWRGNRRVGTGERAEFSLEESPGIIPRQLWEYQLPEARPPETQGRTRACGAQVAIDRTLGSCTYPSIHRGRDSEGR